jgi:hypothetical protein
MAKSEFFDTMMDEAMHEVAKGDKGWREVDSNTLTLACFGYLSKNIIASVSRPFWLFAGVVSTGIIWSIVSDILHID